MNKDYNTIKSNRYVWVDLLSHKQIEVAIALFEDYILDLENFKSNISTSNDKSISVSDIDSNAPLFNEGLGLDSIDALELGMALKKKYNVNFKADKEENKQYFKSVESLAEYIAKSNNITLE